MLALFLLFLYSQTAESIGILSGFRVPLKPWKDQNMPPKSKVRICRWPWLAPLGSCVAKNDVQFDTDPPAHGASLISLAQPPVDFVPTARLLI